MEESRIQSRLLHPEVSSVMRENVVESLKEDRTTQPYYTKYEYVTLVGIRAQQLADGSKPLSSIEGMTKSDPLFVWKLAEKEIAEGKLPFIIHRRMSSDKSEYWSASELSVMW